jgi:hypothetical protein
MLTFAVSWLALSWEDLAAAAPSYMARPFAVSLDKGQSQTINSSLQIDVGYEVYHGVANSITGLSTWKRSGKPCLSRFSTTHHRIRFAAPPTENLRW